MSPSDMNRYDRRKFLKVTGGLTGAGLLAGCLGDDEPAEPDDDDDVDPDPDPDDDDDDEEPEPEVEYPTDDIRFVIPFSAGGGFDAYARALAEFMPQHLPQEVEIIPENVPGAGGRTGANEVYRADDPHTIGIFNVPGKLATQMVADTEYDLDEIAWVGRIAAANYLLYTGPDSGLETWEDVQAADEVSFAATDFSGTAGLVSLVGTQVLGIESDFVTGYEGSAEARTGVIRGDADARYGTWSNLRGPIEDGEVNGIISLTEEPPEWAPDMPTVVEEGHDDAIIGLQRLVGAPPGTDDAVIDVLDEALTATAEDPDFQEWADDAGRPIGHASADDVAAIIESNVETFDQYRDLLEEHIG